MTAAEVVHLHESVRQLLDQQAQVLKAEPVDLERAESLGAEISQLLVSVPAAEHLQGLDDALRVRLLKAAKCTEVALTSCRTILDHHRRKHLADHLRSERDGAALRHYLPPTDSEPAHYLDERR